MCVCGWQRFQITDAVAAVVVAFAVVVVAIDTPPTPLY